jgi:cobyrinic acid a,c-diamide synthase
VTIEPIDGTIEVESLDKPVRVSLHAGPAGKGIAIAATATIAKDGAIDAGAMAAEARVNRPVLLQHALRSAKRRRRVLTRDERVAAPERHLGLVPAVERETRTRASLDALADSAGTYVDLEAVLRLARAAPASPGPAWSADVAGDGTPRARITIARGPAFSFHYAENLELLAAAGAELVPFDPTIDTVLPPATDALILAGGFPEVHGEALAANAALRAEIAAFASRGRPVLAECGGLIYLCRTLDGRPMCAVLPADARMAGRLTLGYREAQARHDSALWRAGDEVRGHEFHYSAVDPVSGERPAWTLRARGREQLEGFAHGAVHASYLHTHWAATPAAARRLVDAAVAVPMVSR